MRRGKRIAEVVFPYEDPKKIEYVFTPGIPVEIPDRPEKVTVDLPKEQPKKKAKNEHSYS